MTKRALVLLASRATALYLIFWALSSFSYVPLDAFSLAHYTPAASVSGADYLYRYHILTLSHHLILSVVYFSAAVWIYKCGPTIERFLSPPEN